MIGQLICPGIIVIEYSAIRIDPGHTQFFPIDIITSVQIFTGDIFSENTGSCKDLCIHLQILLYLALKKCIENKSHAE